MITSTGPDLFTVVGFTSGTSGGPSFTHDAVFVDDAAMLGPFALGSAHAAGRAALRPGRHRRGRLPGGARQLRRHRDHLRSARGRRVAAGGSSTAPGARDRAQPDRRRRRDRQQRRPRGVRAPAGDRPAPCRRRLVEAGVPVVRRGGRDRRARRRPGRHRRRAGAGRRSSTAASHPPTWRRRP